MSALHVQKKWEPFRGRWRLRKPSRPAKTKMGHFAQEENAEINHHSEQVMTIYKNTAFSILKHEFPESQSLNSSGEIC